MATSNGNPTFRRMFQYLWDKEHLNTDLQNEIVCLGVPYSPNSSAAEDADDEARGKWPEEFTRDVDSRIWLTYRTNFPMIPRAPNGPSTISIGGILRGSGIDLAGFTSDIGWGCMIRTAQSLLANALACLRLGREWRRDGSEWEIVKLFADDPLAPLSLHRFVEHGKLYCGKCPGEWFGPSAAASSIKALTEESLDDLRVYISDGSDIYENRLLATAGYEPVIANVANSPPTEPVHLEYPTSTPPVPESSTGQTLPAACEPIEPSQIESPQIESPQVEPPQVEPPQVEPPQVEPPNADLPEAMNQERRLSGSHEQEPVTPDSTDTSLEAPQHDSRALEFRPTLVLLGIRLGIDNVNPVYWQSLKSLLEYPQAVGIAGGRPSSSHYFYGFQGDYLFYLDPHLPRPVLEISPNGSLSDAALDSVHSKRIRMLHLSEMDPSMLVGFLIRDINDWNDWKARVDQTVSKSIINISPHEPVINCHSSISVGSDDEGEFVDVGTEAAKPDKPAAGDSDVISVSEEQEEDPILVQGSSFPGTDDLVSQEACSRVVSADSTSMHDSSFKFTDESYEEFMPDEGYGAPVMIGNDQSFESIEPSGNDYDDWEEMVSSLRKQSISN